MRKAVLISIQPKWCELIASGKKTVEVRKTKPKIDTPFKCYIYCTRSRSYLGRKYKELDNLLGGGMVVGEFVCNEIEELRRNTIFNAPALYSQSCLTRDEYFGYIGNKTAYIWHISDLKIYDKPKELREFGRYDKPIICPQVRCGKCGHWRYMRVNADEYDYDCDCNGLLDNIVYLNRPPQSWCYVEEREGNG